MVNLIKYEFIRKSRLLTISAVIVLILNAVVLIRLKTGFHSAEEEMIALSAFFMGLFGIFFVLFMVDVILMYSQDVSHKSGYMFWLTPNNGYKLLGSKVLTGIIEGIVFLAGLLLLMGINFFGFYGGPLRELLGGNIFQSLIEHLQLQDIQLFPLIGTALLAVFVTLIAIILTIFAAISIRKTILAATKFGGVLSLIIFLLLCWLNEKVSSFIFVLLGRIGLLVEGGSHYAFLATHIVIQALFAGIMFILAAYLLEKKMDF